MRKFKVWHTVDAVLAGYYQDAETGKIDSLLFGLYDDDGLLHYVGHSRVYGVQSTQVAGRRAIQGWPSGTSADSEDTLAFSALPTFAR
jgi:hypothetical protein